MTMSSDQGTVGLARYWARFCRAVGRRAVRLAPQQGPVLASPAPVSSTVATDVAVTLPAIASQQPAAQSDRFASLASMVPGVVYQRVVSPSGDIRYTYISEGSRDIFGVAPERSCMIPKLCSNVQP